MSLCLRLAFSRLWLNQVCKSWRRELEARGLCRKTVQLCSALAGGGDAERLGKNARRHARAASRRAQAVRRSAAAYCEHGLIASTDDDAERSLSWDAYPEWKACTEGGGFLEKHHGECQGDLRE